MKKYALVRRQSRSEQRVPLRQRSRESMNNWFSVFRPMHLYTFPWHGSDKHLSRLAGRVSRANAKPKWTCADRRITRLDARCNYPRTHYRPPTLPGLTSPRECDNCIPQSRKYYATVSAPLDSMDPWECATILIYSIKLIFFNCFSCSIKCALY